MKNEIENESLKKLSVALESNRLYAFMLGIGIYKLDVGNMNKDMVLNTGAIMHTIYIYCKRISNIGNEVQETLEFLANVKTFAAVYAVLEIVTYQLKAEKNNNSPFKLNIEKILNILRNNLKNNLNVYSQKGELGNYSLEKGMLPLLQDYDNNLEENYGHKIL